VERAARETCAATRLVNWKIPLGRAFFLRDWPFVAVLRVTPVQG